MYCFERFELSATYSLMALMRQEISSDNSFYAANIRGDNSLQLFILSKRFGWICGWVLLYVKLPWNFPQRFESSAWPMLFATIATLSVSIVSMRLGSFTYSTFGSHRGQSFKLFYKKIKKAPPQARPPPSWNTESVETRRVTRFYYAHHLKVASHQFCGKFTSIGKTSKAVYGSEKCM